MIVEYTRYKIDPSRNNDFEEAYRRAGALLDASPHCLRWEAARCLDEPEKQIVRIEWDSVEGDRAVIMRRGGTHDASNARRLSEANARHVSRFASATTAPATPSISVEM